VAPTLSTNTGITVGRGASTNIDSNALSASSSGQDAGQTIFTLTSLPGQGTLLLDGRALEANSTFTQDDINNNRLSFRQQPGAQLPSGLNDPFAPQISGSNVAWTAYDGNDYEIYFYNGSTTTRLTDNSVDDLAPQISGTNVVWQSGTGSSADIFFYNGSSGSTSQFSQDDREDINPKVSGSNVVWQKKGDSSSDIYFYNGGTFNVIDTGTTTDDVTPAISGSEITFRRADFENTANSGVYVYNLNSASSQRIGSGEIAANDSFSFRVSAGGDSTDGSIGITIS
jgi:beta propeller repeat protein